MYQTRHFAEHDPARLHALIDSFPLATVMLSSPDGVEANPIPLLRVDTENGAPALIGHVAAGNPLAGADGRAVTILFHGPNAYVSPNWYPSKAEQHKAVPTWNYALVEVRGTIHTFSEPTRLEAVVRMLTDRFEAAQETPWSIDDAPAEYRAAMYKAIVGIEIDIRSMTGKFKLSQNRSSADIDGVIQGLRTGANPQQLAVADAMHKCSKDASQPGP